MLRGIVGPGVRGFALGAALVAGFTLYAMWFMLRPVVVVQPCSEPPVQFGVLR